MISTRMARFPMYQANASINEQRYAYSLCLHVKSGTIFVGVVNLAGSMALYFLLNIGPWDDTIMYWTTILPYPLLATLSAMLIYGVVKSKPCYSLSFFAIQFFDYIFTIPYFLIKIYTYPIHRYKALEQLDAMETADHRHNYDHNVMLISKETIFTSIMFSLIVILIKTYFLVTVFKYCRYLHSILTFTVNHTSLHTGSTMAPIVVAVGSMSPINEEATSMTESKPPGYEEATSITESKPPGYEQVTSMTESKPPGYEQAVQLGDVAIDQDNSGVGVSGANNNHTPSGRTQTIVN